MLEWRGNTGSGGSFDVMNDVCWSYLEKIKSRIIHYQIVALSIRVIFPSKYDVIDNCDFSVKVYHKR